MIDKVKYTCKNCGWATSIREEWSDMKPKRCMNKKCNTSFQKSPDSLQIDLPQKLQPVEEKRHVNFKKSKKNEEAESDS